MSFQDPGRDYATDFEIPENFAELERLMVEGGEEVPQVAVDVAEDELLSESLYRDGDSGEINHVLLLDVEDGFRDWMPDQSRTLMDEEDLGLWRVYEWSAGDEAYEVEAMTYQEPLDHFNSVEEQVRSFRPGMPIFPSGENARYTVEYGDGVSEREELEEDYRETWSSRNLP